MVKVSNLRNQKCSACKVSLRNKNYSNNVRRISTATIERVKEFHNNNEIQINDYICNRCFVKMCQKTNKHSLDRVDEETISLDPVDIGSSTSIGTPEILEVNNTVELFMALSTHKHCILCKNQKGLHLIKAESILFAYQNYGLIIKKDSRCCNRHLENGLIKHDEFSQIPKKLHFFDKSILQVLDISITNAEKVQNALVSSSGIFDKFKNMAAMEERFCLKISGWTKSQFCSFSKLITSVQDTAGRSKEQFIAIYRYWLSKGLDQCSLALLNSDTSQQQISHFLALIRKAMNVDIVPLFLGANKGKHFFLNHNTSSVKILHDLDKNVLAIIVDGSYTKLKKSSNNQFQYLSYSIHKSDNSMKAFIICCADGYYIDCYEPFPATLNNANIFLYILKTDSNIIELC